ncbi:hypothetical protein HMPREF2869_02220 [Lactobacillus sp. HMSC061B07]|nr:helix-turn-helix domain-containing protein [Lacticaseibacillus rhamnosus]MDU5201929.1 helix-turn-helix domain-containing protein [Lacticaseibacillus rhamnosus]OFR79575.1 hypothetical protein HMPREF2869_02220 [Lactobacillus sp. HMSC061B07]WNX16601.1 helix-turn-helix domain-containing protein [Lacticaseibacillus rhamnosus]
MALMKAQITLPADFDQILQERIHREVVRVMNETKQQPMQKKLNIGQAAVYAGVARNTLLSWTRKDLPMQVVGGVKRINTADIDDYMNNHGK